MSEKRQYSLSVSKIRDARILKGYSQKTLAEAVGIGKTSIVLIEKGDFMQVSLGRLLKISEVLEVPFKELFLNK